MTPEKLIEYAQSALTTLEQGNVKGASNDLRILLAGLLQSRATLSSPCACKGKEPLARFTTDIVVGILDVHVPDGCPDGRVLILVLPVGVPSGA